MESIKNLYTYFRPNEEKATIGHFLERKGHETFLNIGYQDVDSFSELYNPLEFKDVYMSFEEIDDLFLQFIFHVCNLYLNPNNSPNPRHIILREIIPADVLTDDYVADLTQIYLEMNPNPDRPTKDNLKNFKDLFIYDYLKMYFYDFRIPDEAKIPAQIEQLYKDGKQLFFMPAEYLTLKSEIEEYGPSKLYYIYDLAVRNIICSCFAAYNEKNANFRTYFNKFKVEIENPGKPDKDKLTKDQVLKNILKELYDEIGNYVEKMIRYNRTLAHITYTPDFNEYITFLKDDYCNSFSNKHKFIVACQKLNELDLDILILSNVNDKVYKLINTYFSYSYKYSVYPKEYSQEGVYLLYCKKKYEILEDVQLEDMVTIKSVKKKCIGMCFILKRMEREYNIRLDIIIHPKCTDHGCDGAYMNFTKEVLAYKLHKSYYMHVMLADFKTAIDMTHDFYRSLDPYFKDHYVPFRAEYAKHHLYSTSYQCSSLQGDLEASDVSMNYVDSVLMSNWNEKYFDLIPVKGLHSMLVYVSLKGFKYDKNLKAEEYNQKYTEQGVDYNSHKTDLSKPSTLPMHKPSTANEKLKKLTSIYDQI